MLVYLDESGCSGMRLDRGASFHYTVAATFFKTRLDADACFQHIQLLRDNWHIAREFHFNKLRHDLRIRFLEEMLLFPFEYSAVTIDKTRIARNERTLNPEVVRHPVLTMFRLLEQDLHNSTVVVDRTGGTLLLQTLSRRLRDDLNTDLARPAIRSVKELESHKHCLLQLADMVCGAVARSLRADRPNATAYRNIIRRRERNFEVWPSA